MSGSVCLEPRCDDYIYHKWDAQWLVERVNTMAVVWVHSNYLVDPLSKYPAWTPSKVHALYFLHY